MRNNQRALLTYDPNSFKLVFKNEVQRPYILAIQKWETEGVCFLARKPV